MKKHETLNTELYRYTAKHINGINTTHVSYMEKIDADIMYVCTNHAFSEITQETLLQLETRIAVIQHTISKSPLSKIINAIAQSNNIFKIIKTLKKEDTYEKSKNKKFDEVFYNDIKINVIDAMYILSSTGFEIPWICTYRALYSRDEWHNKFAAKCISIALSMCEDAKKIYLKNKTNCKKRSEIEASAEENILSIITEKILCAAIDGFMDICIFISLRDLASIIKYTHPSDYQKRIPAELEKNIIDNVIKQANGTTQNVDIYKNMLIPIKKDKTKAQNIYRSIRSFNEKIYSSAENIRLNSIITHGRISRMLAEEHKPQREMTLIEKLEAKYGNTNDLTSIHDNLNLPGSYNRPANIETSTGVCTIVCSMSDNKDIATSNNNNIISNNMEENSNQSNTDEDGIDPVTDIFVKRIVLEKIYTDSKETITTKEEKRTRQNDSFFRKMNRDMTGKIRTGKNATPETIRQKAGIFTYKEKPA